MLTEISSEESKQIQKEVTNLNDQDLHKGYSYLLDPNYDVLQNCKVTHPIEGEENDIYLIENLLSQKECNDIIENLRQEQFIDPEGFKPEERTSKRKRTYDVQMSEIILNRLLPFIPLKTIEIDECQWELSRFMPYWRYCKYGHNDLFAPHYDGSKKLIQPKQEIYEMSLYTLNLYLNDGFGQGGTRFYMNCEEMAPRYDYKAAREVTHNIPPKQGVGLIFNHCNKGYLHDGEALDVANTVVKEKFLMRADLVYTLKPSDVPKLKRKQQEGTCRF